MDVQPNSGPLKGYDSFKVRLGDELRGERATLGKSLLDVQRDLRIKAAYIAAIENCDTSVFQNKGFVAGYVRSYARYLNLDAEEVFARFSAEARFGGVNEGMNPKPAKAGEKVARAKPSKVPVAGMLIHPASRRPVLNKGPFSGFSPSAMGSVAVLALLIAGLGFGAWSILKDIQRVQLVPVDQTPGASAVVTTPEMPQMAEAASGAPAEGADGRSDLLYSRVYRPQELDVPVLDYRDGPIAAIDPGNNGAFPAPQKVEASEIESLVQLAAATGVDGLRDPQLVAAEGPPQVSVFATNPAWVRVYLTDGSKVFEKILDPGEAYVLPADIQNPLLRAGNSGAVFLAVNGIAYGPLGDSSSVAKDISLNSADIPLAWPLAAEQAAVAAAAVAAATGSAVALAETSGLDAETITPTAGSQ